MVIGLLIWLQWWTKVAISSEKRENFEIFLSQMNIFSKKIFKNILKVVSIRFRWFWDDLRKKYFFDFSDEILDFGSLWKPHCTFNQYILLVVLSLPIVQQFCGRIWSLHYWFGCSDSPKLPISSKNAIFAICGHFWAWPLWATFWISNFKLSYDTFPMIEFMYPAP